MKTLILILAGLFTSLLPRAQQGWWRAQVHRPDGEIIPFNFEWKKIKSKNQWVIKNAAERIIVNDIRVAGDSLIIQMPVFESAFHVRLSENFLSGIWIKGGALKTTVLPFTAMPDGLRFDNSSSSKTNVAGTWSARFEGDTSAVVAEFNQSGQLVTGTFLSPTGDYRYLEGLVKNDSLLLSAFDGSHCYLFKAAVGDGRMQGAQYSGAAGLAKWSAAIDSSATVSEASVVMRLRPGEDSLHFSFRDLDGNPVSIAGKRFRNKVVVVQLMGSWCPNCMDETAFLSDYYRRNKQRGIEMVALAYEYSTDRERSVKSLRKFQQRYRVQYPILITGVTVLDSLRTEKTLPELTPIKFFPSSVIIDKKGIVRKLDTGFNGPATGAHYDRYKKDFEETIAALVAEK